MEKIYLSWLKRTATINCDCKLCNNERYLLELQGNLLKWHIFACPSCNWDDLQISKDCDYFPLNLFPKIKSGALSINLLNS